MDYQTVASLTQSAALVFFVLLFLCVLAYTFWPSNRSRFERAARLPLEHGEADRPNRRNAK